MVSAEKDLSTLFLPAGTGGGGTTVGVLYGRDGLLATLKTSMTVFLFLLSSVFEWL